ncbi:oxysterol-binding protein-related protein 1A-like [Rutidosis leptorrhynchoides]|uniref:oxysterol-binding protein-related protein 1A-like n=1 Tax=Rutidosis leptorrhynchoides TaxID=125765 RepID=UPI003A99D8A4
MQPCVDQSAAHNHQQFINDGSKRVATASFILGNGISGILYQWVNYGKGWRPRWFVLQDGVLSYYKIHGPDKIVVSQDKKKGSRIIGEKSRRSKNANANDQYHLRPPGDKVHLLLVHLF